MSTKEALTEKTTVHYDDGIVRAFVWACVVFGIVGMSVGAIAALQLAYPSANVAPELSFGRLRPLHTNAIIFAFVGNCIFAGIYYSTQRLLKTRMASDLLSKLHFGLWQLAILLAAISLPLGWTQAKEYAELEWPIDILVTVTWVIFAVNFFWTLSKRRERHLYVALWFYIATIVTIAVLYIVNNLAIPIGLTKSYSVFGGVQDALVQWWYGHNAVAFFLTTPVLGLMYYFVPKAANRPVYSYRLSIVHFWSLVFIYIWAGPHHLLNTALPDWAQTLGVVFSLMLWAPSWGGMLNGLLTLRGAWDQLRVDPVLKFFAVALTSYGMVTFEGPLLSIKGVSALAHYTDWIIAHVHNGGLGWNGFMAAGMMYWLIPKLYGRALHSVKAANFHFWIGTFGTILYVGSMWVAGVTEGLMWRAETVDGGLQYSNWIETIDAIRPMYWMRLIGGTTYLIGFVICLWNLVMTARAGEPVNESFEVVDEVLENNTSWKPILLGGPVIVGAVGMVLLVLVGVTKLVASIIFMVFLVCVIGAVTFAFAEARKNNASSWHTMVEQHAFSFVVLTLLVILIGGVAEIVPTLIAAPELAAKSQQTPYSALELEGRDVYIKEGCYNCHSQMVRPFKWEAARFEGRVSHAEDSVYDHPFQWGSKRTGPDLAFVGGKYNNVWHYEHMINPAKMNEGSNMPPYPHLANETFDYNDLPDKLRAMRTVGVPYGPTDIENAAEFAKRDARAIATQLAKDVNIATCETGACNLRVDSELVALIAYLQRVGKNASPKYAQGESK